MRDDTQLKIIIAILTSVILATVFDINRLNFGSELIYSTLFLFYKISYSFIYLYLFKFVKFDKKQYLSFIPTLIILLTIAFAIITHFVPITIDRPENQTSQQAMMKQFLIGLPGLIQMIAEIILSIQLIRNNAERASQRNIRFIGISYLITICCTFLVPFVLTYMPIEAMALGLDILGLIYLLPLAAMLYLYINEIKISKQTSLQ